MVSRSSTNNKEMTVKKITGFFLLFLTLGLVGCAQKSESEKAMDAFKKDANSAMDSMKKEVNNL
jgi:outer membrane lipoprotein-sorting protein